MGSREKILDNISRHKSELKHLPDQKKPGQDPTDAAMKFSSVLQQIGGKAVEIKNWNSLKDYIDQHYKGMLRIVSTVSQLPWTVDKLSDDPHTFEDVDLAILQGHFGVAENAAVWITDELMGDRALPFIAQNLALVIKKNSIVPTLHQAYEKIDSQVYNFGTFIAGPSKTADIEQSLVLGAHGPKSMVVFLMESGQ